MRAMALRIRSSARIATALIGVVLLSFGAFVIVETVGELLVPLLAILLVAAVAIQWPRVALGLALVPAVLFEDVGGSGFLSFGGSFYDAFAFVSPFEASLILLLVSTMTTITARRSFVVPGPLTGPLVLGFVAMLVGCAIGYSAGTSAQDILFLVRPMLALLLMPFAVVNILSGRDDLRRLLQILAILVAFKAGIGIVGVIAGAGYLNADGPPISYMAPTVNWLCLSLLLYLAAAGINRDRPPALLLAAGLLCFVSLLLSYRRSFWLAAVAALLIVVVAAGSRGWRVVLPTVGVVAAIAVVLTLSGGISGLSGPLAERAESLRPGRVTTNVDDRYRIDERRNALADIAENPISGVGLGQPWTARFALPVDRPGSRTYVHFTAIWLWLQYGLLGLAFYLWLIGAAIWLAFRVSREQQDPVLKASGLAAVGAIAAIALVETTASFTAVTIRFSTVFGAILGLLAAALLDARRTRRARSPVGSE